MRISDWSSDVCSSDLETATQSTLIESEDDAHEEQRRWDSFQQDAEAPLTQTEAERVRVQQLERARFQGEERLKRLEAEFGALTLAPVQNSLNEADSELASLAPALEQPKGRANPREDEL